MYICHSINTHTHTHTHSTCMLHNRIVKYVYQLLLSIPIIAQYSSFIMFLKPTNGLLIAREQNMRKKDSHSHTHETGN